MKREEMLFIKDILESICNIETFSKDLSKTDFLRNRLKQSAIIREFEIVGEAVKNISELTKRKYPKVEWKRIAGARDIFIHSYFIVNLDRVWQIITGDLLKLKTQIEKIKKDLESKKE